MTKIRISSGEFVFIAETKNEAPHTVKTFLDMLPYQQQLIHVRWSGEGCWIPLGEEDYSLPWENATSHPAVGDILFYPGGYSETEIILAYGPCCFSSKLGQLAGNHFLSIVEGREQLQSLGKRCLWHGSQEVVFELAE
jgi:hypothetical protein